LHKAHEIKETPKKESDDEGMDGEEALAMMENENAFEIERSVFPSLSSFIERLDDNLWKSYLQLRHTDVEYLKRINDENRLLFLIDDTLGFLRPFNVDIFAARISQTKLTYLYYKNDAIYKRIRQRNESKGSKTSTESSSSSPVYFLENSEAEINSLVDLITRQG